MKTNLQQGTPHFKRRVQLSSEHDIGGRTSPHVESPCHILPHLEFTRARRAHNFGTSATQIILSTHTSNYTVPYSVGSQQFGHSKVGEGIPWEPRAMGDCRTRLGLPPGDRARNQASQHGVNIFTFHEVFRIRQR